MNHFFHRTLAGLTSMFSWMAEAWTTNWVGRLLAVGAIAITLLGVSGLYIPTAQAAATPEAEAYEPGPIRQTRNPVSNENFHGGVDPSIVDRREDARQPEEDNKTLLDRIQDVFSNKDTEQAPANLHTEKNPTLDRYIEDRG